MIHENTSLSH